MFGAPSSLLILESTFFPAAVLVWRSEMPYPRSVRQLTPPLMGRFSRVVVISVVAACVGVASGCTRSARAGQSAPASSTTLSGSVSGHGVQLALQRVSDSTLRLSALACGQEVLGPAVVVAPDTVVAVASEIAGAGVNDIEVRD